MQKLVPWSPESSSSSTSTSSLSSLSPPPTQRHRQQSEETNHFPPFFSLSPPPPPPPPPHLSLSLPPLALEEEEEEEIEPMKFDQMRHMASEHYPLPIPRDGNSEDSMLCMLASVQRQMAIIGEGFVNLKNTLLPLLYALSNERRGGVETERVTTGQKTLASKRPCMKRPAKIPKAYTEIAESDHSHIVNSKLVILPTKKKRKIIEGNESNEIVSPPPQKKRRSIGEKERNENDVKMMASVIQSMKDHTESVIELTLDLGSICDSSQAIRCIASVKDVLQNHLLYTKMVHMHAIQRRKK